MKIKIVTRGGRLYGYGVATAVRLQGKEKPTEGEEGARLEDVERICALGQIRKTFREQEIREAVRAEREREIRDRIARQREKKARRAAKLAQAREWIKTGAMILALIAGVIALLWLMAGEAWAAAGMAPMLLIGGRMQ